MFSSIIFIHELGHFLMAKYFKWNIDKIYLYPYGGYTKFNDDLNRPIYQEIFIMLAGPIMQIMYYLIIINFLRDSSIILFKSYHYTILFFNLLPIYPLDGGKLLNALINYYVPFKKSFHLIIIISFSIILLGISYFYISKINLSLSFLLVIITVICKLTSEACKEKYYYNKFLLERYLNKYSFKKVRIINNLDQMYRDCKHVFFKRGKNYSEKEVLMQKFTNNN